MSRKTISWLVLVVLACLLTLSFEVELPKASGYIYINSDGSVDGTDKIQRHGDIYTLAGDIESKQILVLKHDIILDGAYHSLSGMAEGRGIDLSNKVNVTVRNFTIAFFTTAILIRKSSHCNIYSNEIKLSQSNGINVTEDSSYNTILGNNIKNNKGDGIYFNNSSNNFIYNNTITDNQGHSIVFDHCSYNSISGNIITDLNFYDSDHNVFFRNNITGLTGLFETTHRWIEIVCSSPTFSYNSISENTLTYSTLWFTNSSYNFVGGNRISDPTGAAIDLYRSSANTISGNNITNSHQDPRYLMDCVSLRESAENILTNNQLDNVTRSGIYLGNCSRNNVSGNTITNCLSSGYPDVCGNGIMLYISDFNVLSGNNITKADVDGIQLVESDCNSISGNIIENNNDIGVLLEDSRNNTISANMIRNNNGTGIYLGNGLSYHNNVAGNNIIGNHFGVKVVLSFSNNFYDNNFLNNTIQAYAEETTTYNAWDGNYWSDYEGTGAYVIEPDNLDNFPHPVPKGPVPFTWKGTDFDCSFAGNMTLVDFGVEQDKTIAFRTIGQGWINLTIPTELLSGTFQVFINNTETLSFASWNKQHTNTSIYFECKVSGSSNVKIEAEMKILGDINGDGQVNIVDITIVAMRFGQTLNP